MNWLAEILFNFINELLTGTIELLGFIINNVFDLMYLISSSLVLEGIRTYSRGIGLALVSVFAIKQGIDVYVLRGEGDPDSDPLEMLTRTAQTVATIMCGTWVINKLTYYSKVVTDDVAGIMNNSGSVSTILLSCMKSYEQIEGIAAFIYMILHTIMVIALFIMVFMAAKRAAELELFKILIPLLAINLMTTSRERWNSFKQELIISIFGYIMQVLCFNVFVVILKKLAEDPANIIYVFTALGWIMLVLSAPKWLEKISYSSGLGNQAKGGARTAVYMLPSILGKIK